MNDTTRKFSRTMNAAFPFGADYASSIEHHRRGEPRWTVIVGCAVLGWVFAVLLMWGVS